MKDLKAMFGKKSKEVDPVKKEAKLNALKGLRSMATDMGSDDVKKGMSKVTVAADDKEDLKEGLEKAKEMVDPAMEKLEEAAGADLDDDQEVGESEEHQDKVLAECNDVDEIDAMMKKLEEKKKALILQR